ncbi:TonB-dependent receptor [Pseudohaliea rubra]|uniref:TonB-dependent receptor n=1 Tax=Pseudohaliea rubra DSM 19751 TaxID=1265313 RepID=A0A095XY65_9GAMM|nr:TonB-dependent receptor [Pseudohaliea rubra]KGE04686.1 TonB-dependent receptor [Pseudohaliea rubra DSM 19751]
MFTRIPLYTAVTLAVAALSSPILAQDGQRIEEVTVVATPIRDAQQAALDAKRVADNVVDVVSADTIGRFPDQNIADSLSRLPGVAVERDQGQARYLNLRGAPFRYTGIAFDGIDVPGAENGRIPRFDSFPATITSRIDANKAILPSMPGESVAGYINIQTFKPFDVEGLSLAVDLGMGEQDLGGGDVGRNSFRASWSGEQFGVVGFYSNNLREQVTDNREFDLERDGEGALVVNELDYRSYLVTREDTAYGGRVDYRGEGALRSLFLSTLYSEFIDEEDLTQYVFASAQPQAGVQANGVPMATSRFVRFGDYKNSTFTNTLGADFSAGGWDLEARLNYTETEFSQRIPIALSVGAGNVGSYDLRDREDPLLDLAVPLAESAFAADIGLDLGNRMDIEATKFKLDASRDLELFGRDSTVAVGMQYDRRESEGFIFIVDFGGFPDLDIASFDTGVPWESNTTNSIGGTYYDSKGVQEAWLASGLLAPQPNPSSDELVAIEEDIVAVYGMATTRFAWGNVVYGLRMEQTDYTSSGLAGDQPLTVEDDFLNILPSLHVNVDLADDLKFRVSASSGVNRPTYNEWRAGAIVSPTDQLVSGGNPFLDPEETIGVDLSLEWYYATASIVSVGAFHREIDNVIYQDVTTIDGGRYLPSAAGESWRLSGAANGSDGKLSGLEANLMFSATDYLEGPLGGLGFSVNATFIDSEFEALDGRQLGLPGTSELIYNASLFYENFGLSARINYQYRDEWISPIEDPEEFWGEMERVDATIAYELPLELGGARASVYANFNNLTDETDVRFAGNGTINQSESFGRHYLLGLRINY